MSTKNHWALRALLAGSVVLVGGLGLGACGDDDAPVAESGALTTTTGGEGADMADEGGDEHGSFEFGEPAMPADGGRTVEVSMADAFSYEPDAITVQAGDTIVFEVTNTGELPHEFVLGDHELQVEHEQEMADMGAGMMTDEPNAIAVPPGETKSLAFTFTEPGELEYACHQPGHYSAGMVGSLTVTAS